MPVDCVKMRCIYESCSTSATAGVKWRCVKMSYSVKIIPPRLIVAHFSAESQTKSALQRERSLTCVLGAHMSFMKGAPEVCENAPLHNDVAECEAAFRQHLGRRTLWKLWGRMCHSMSLSRTWKCRKWLCATRHILKLNEIKLRWQPLSPACQLQTIYREEKVENTSHFDMLHN